MGNNLIAFVLLPIIFALLAILARKGAAILSVMAATLLSGFAGYLYFVKPLDGMLFGNFGPELMLDSFSLLLLITANLVAALVFVYSSSYAKKFNRPDLFFGLFLVLLAGINGTLLAADFVWLYIFLEIAAVSAYILVAFEGGRRQLQASFKYFILGEIASIFILVGAGLVYKMSGSFNFFAAASAIPENITLSKGLAIALFIAGFGTKAAIMPFHAWLPDAHSAAPSPVSAILSGVIIKVLGVYCLARVLFNIVGIDQGIAFVILVLSAISIIIAGILSLGQNDIKRIMAYSSISQVGYIALGLFLMVPSGLIGAIFHIFNHAFMKSLLFLNAGAIETQTGKRNLAELGGIREKMPVSAATSLVGSFAISGLPPFNGFWSKVMIILACVQTGNLLFALIAVIGSLLTMGAYFKMQKNVFFGELKSSLSNIKEAPLAMCFSMTVLAVICLAIGLAFPMVLKMLIKPAAAALAGGKQYFMMVKGG